MGGEATAYPAPGEVSPSRPEYRCGDESKRVSVVGRQLLCQPDRTRPIQLMEPAGVGF
jgi:hypothetical protein